MRSRELLGALCLVGVAACGTTVPLASQQSAPTGSTSDALGAPAVGATLVGPTAGASRGTVQQPAPGGSTTPAVVPGRGAAPSAPGPVAPGTGPSTPAVRGPGAARDTSPLLVGYMGAASADAALGAIGAGGSGGQPPQEAFDHFVRALNARGGLNGRQVKVVSSFIDPISSNYDTQAAAACAKFTQDNKVAAVFAVESFYYSESFSACVAKSGIPEIVALAGGTDARTLAKYPTMLSPTAPTVERRFAALIKGLSGNGYLSRASKVGVVVEDCPHNERVFASTVAPMLKDLGASVTSRTVSCVHGFGDAANYIAAVQGQVLPLRSAGVDRVVFVTGFEQIATQYFEQQAANQGWKPRYALTSTAYLGTNPQGFSGEALSRVQGVGWQPALDVGQLPVGPAATQRCQQLWKGYAPASVRANRQNNDTTCDVFFLLEAALARTGGSTAPAALLRAFSGLGASYSSPLSLGGGTRFGPGRKDGPALFATFGYRAACTCTAYTGPPRPLA